MFYNVGWRPVDYRDGRSTEVQHSFFRFLIDEVETGNILGNLASSKAPEYYCVNSVSLSN